MNKRGIQFSNKDTWSLDHTLSPIILSALLKFKECSGDRKGVPCNLLCEIFPDVKYNHTEEQLEEGEKAWQEILDKMIYSFDKKNEPKISDYNFKFITTFDPPKENGSKRMHISHTNDDEYQRYCIDAEEHGIKVEEGHLLFGKYFRNLWW